MRTYLDGLDVLKLRQTFSGSQLVKLCEEATEAVLGRFEIRLVSKGQRDVVVLVCEVSTDHAVDLSLSVLLVEHLLGLLAGLAADTSGRRRFILEDGEDIQLDKVSTVISLLSVSHLAHSLPSFLMSERAFYISRIINIHYKLLSAPEAHIFSELYYYNI